jgi:hypothetical protein
LPPPVSIGSTVSIDLLLPTNQANPFWFGAMQMFVSCPSCNLFNAYLGQVELTGLPTGAYQTLRFAVPAGVAASVSSQAKDFTVTVVLNVPSNSTGSYLLDHLVLSTAPAVCTAANSGASCDDGNPCTSGDTCAAGSCQGQPIANCTIDPATQSPVGRWGTPQALSAFFPDCTNPGDTLTMATTTPFTLPSTITLSGKAASTLSLTFGRPLLSTVTCTYTAAASSSTAPRTAALSSCSDGSKAGQAVLAGVYSLKITSAAGVPTPGDGVCAHSPVSARLPLGTDAIPTLPEPFTPAETTALVSGFSWAATTPVTELDSQGRPLLYYAIVYLENRQQVSMLDQLEIHHDFLPMFEGLDRWRGLVGAFTHHGDGKGVYTFALMTGAQYNFVRQGALAGTVAFKAINLRTPPPAFRNPDGLTVSYRALGNIRFRYRGIDPIAAAQQAPMAPILCALDLGGAVKGLVQDGANAFHAVSNFISGLIGDAAGVFIDSTSASFQMELLNTDPTFNTPARVNLSKVTSSTAYPNDQDFDPTKLRQAWGQLAGSQIYPDGVTMEARGVHLPYYQSTKLDALGQGSLSFLDGIETGICLLLKNDAVDVIDFVTTVEMCDFGPYTFHLGGNPSSHFKLIDIKADYTNVLGVTTDSQNYAGEVLTSLPDQEEVLVGHYADLMPNPITPCLTLSNLGTSVTFASTLLAALALVESPEDAAALTTVGDCIYEADSIIPSKKGFARSRAVTAHEYGHWTMCGLLGDVGLSTAYDAAILETISPIPPIEFPNECNQACGNEGFADFISSQVVGATTYFKFNQSMDDLAEYSINISPPGFVRDAVLAKYCPSTEPQCFDDNVGGSGQASDKRQDVRTTNKGRFTATLHDFFDGNPAAHENVFSEGNLWKDTGPLPGQSLLPSLAVDPQTTGQIGDETVQLTPHALVDAVFHRRGISIDQDAIFGGLVDQAYAEGANWCQLCRLFAAHTGVCKEDGTTPDCTATIGQSALYADCAAFLDISKWIGPPPSSSDPNSCTFVPITSCPSGQAFTCCDPNGAATCGTTSCCTGATTCTSNGAGLANCCPNDQINPTTGACCGGFGFCTTNAECNGGSPTGTNKCATAKGCCQPG